MKVRIAAFALGAALFTGASSNAAPPGQRDPDCPCRSFRSRRPPDRRCRRSHRPRRLRQHVDKYRFVIVPNGMRLLGGQRNRTAQRHRRRCTIVVHAGCRHGAIHS